MLPIMIFVGNLGYVAVAVLGGWLAIQGQVSIGDIQAFIQYMNQFTQPITQTANIANVLQSTAAAAERVFEFLDEPKKSRRDAATRRSTRPTVGATVEFDHVVFGYDPDKTIIKDFSASHRARSARGHRRSDRRRQDHYGQSADALLRSRSRRDPDRRRSTSAI